MVRNYKKKRPGEVNEDDMKNAVDKVVSGQMKLSEAAETFNVKVNTLFYRVRRHKNYIKSNSDDFNSKYTFFLLLFLSMFQLSNETQKKSVFYLFLFYRFVLCFSNKT